MHKILRIFMLLSVIVVIIIYLLFDNINPVSYILSGLDQNQMVLGNNISILAAINPALKGIVIEDAKVDQSLPLCPERPPKLGKYLPSFTYYHDYRYSISACIYQYLTIAP